MVRLYRGVSRGRGRQIGRPPFMNRPMRPIRPSGFEPEIPPFVRPMGRGRMLRPGPPGPPRLPLSPRMLPGHIPPRPPLPPHPADHHLRPPRPPLALHPAELLPHLRPPRPLLPPHHADVLPHLRPPRPPMPPHPAEPLPRLRAPLGLRPRMPPMPPPRHMVPPGLPLRRPLRAGPGAMRGRGTMLRRGMGLKRLGSSAKKSQKRKEKTEEMEVNKPWVTEVLKLAIQKKHQLHKLVKEKNNLSDWQAYKEQRILVGKMTSTAKIEYIGSHPEADVDEIMFGANPKG